MPTVSLPVLTATPPLRITPTDVSSFVRLEQCERFLRFRLAERAGVRFMDDYGVAPQRLAPLHSLSGREFEEGVEKDIAAQVRAVHYAAKYSRDHNRPANNTEVVAEAKSLPVGQTVVLFQARLHVEVEGWLLRGDVDVLRFERDGQGRLKILIADMKSTVEVKVEHRLQVAFYAIMLERLLTDSGVNWDEVQIGILFRPPTSTTTEQEVEVLPPLRDAAKKWFKLDAVLLEVVADQEAYRRSTRDLVTAPDSTARRIAATDFDSLPFCLSYKCDGCLYNEWCMKESAEREDLSLLPYMTGVEKEALRRAGVGTIQALAALKDLTPAGELAVAAGRETVVRQLAATWPVGPRLDELIHRAKQFRKSVRRDGTAALSYIPGKGQSSLPACTPSLNPDMIRIFVEAQHDHLNDRLWSLAALVVGAKGGQTAPTRRRFVVIERHVALNEWVGTRHAPPERHVLMGETLLARYVEADQDPEVAEQNRENRLRHRRRADLEAEHRARFPGKQFRLGRDQAAECRWTHDGMRIKLRVHVTEVDCDLHEALTLSNLREGDRLVMYPRWTVDERQPAAARIPFTPTPRQLLYGNRAELGQITAVEKDGAGRVLAAMVEIELKDSFGGDWSRGFVFPAISRPLEDGAVYTLDPCPNDWYGYWCNVVVDGLCKGEQNRLFKLLNDPVSWGRDASGLSGQAKFLAGLLAFQSEGLLHDFEKSKRTFIGGYGKAPVVLVQGPPGTGKSYSTAFAVFARLQGAMQAGRDLRVFVCCKTHAATDVLVQNLLDVRKKLAELRAESLGLFNQFLDHRLLEVPLIRVSPHDPPPDGVVHLLKDAEKEDGSPKNADIVQGHPWCVVGVTPGGVYSLLKGKWPKALFGHGLCDVLVLDEASQMNLPEAMMAALPLKADGQVIVVGDHRQMPPIVKHDWEQETRRTFKQYEVYTSLFDTLRQHNPPFIQFEESFRLHSAMAGFLREEVYAHDGINYFSRRTDRLPAKKHDDPLVAAALHPDYPLVVIVHDEEASQVRNPFEQSLIDPVLRFLASAEGLGLDAEKGLGVVVPHRAQRAALQAAFPELCILDPVSGLPAKSAIDTVERFQGGERTVIMVSATESDRGYLLQSSGFLLDPRRLTVALSRAKRKMILVASRSIFGLFSPDEETFNHALLWKNLLVRACPTLLWEGERQSMKVAVWGGK